MTNGPLKRKLKMGLVGGGVGSFIGKVHSIAACLDNRAELVAGAFSSDPDRSKASAADYDVRGRSGLRLLGNVRPRAARLPTSGSTLSASPPQPYALRDRQAALKRLSRGVRQADDV